MALKTTNSGSSLLLTDVGNAYNSPAPELKTEPSHSTSKPTNRTAIGFYCEDVVATRIRAAYKACGWYTADKTFSDFVARILLVETVKLEKKYNDGKPFEPIVDKPSNGGR